MSRSKVRVKYCGDCPFHQAGSEYPSSWCTAARRNCYPMGHWSPGKKRPDWCPLPVLVQAKATEEKSVAERGE